MLVAKIGKTGSPVHGGTPDKELALRADVIASQSSWHVERLTKAARPRSGRPERLYIRNGVMVWATFLGPDQELNVHEQWWTDQLGIIQAQSNGALVHHVVKADTLEAFREAMK